MSNTFLLLDAARVAGSMEKARELNPTYKSLYMGGAEEDLADVAPYFFDFKKDTEFYNWYIDNGWGESWGLILHSEFHFEETYRHFRKFLMVKTHDEKQLYFRFYDPRVLRIFLPTCNKQQLKEFFGPVEQFVCEDADPDFGLAFTFDENNLMTTRVNKVDIL